MHLEQLQAILEVASTGSISAAARNLETNQPSLSRTIKTLEKELNVNFFERTSNGVQLTEAGERLLPYISQIIQDVYQLSKEAFRITTDTCPELSAEPAVVRLSTAPIILDALLGTVLTEIAQTLPQIQVNINLIDNQNPNELLKLPDYDLFIGQNIAHALDESLIELQNTGTMQLDNLFTENFQFIVHRSHPLASHKILSLDDILEYPIILHDNGFSSNDFYQNYLHNTKKMTVLFKSNNPNSVTEALRKTSALFLTTDLLSQKDYAQCHDLRMIPARNLQIEYFALYKKERTTQCAIKEIISILKFVHAKINISK